MAVLVYRLMTRRSKNSCYHIQGLVCGVGKGTVIGSTRSQFQEIAI
jgi:hypothetical protein